MDILGPFTTASRGRKYLIVAIDYFTKWIEAEPTKYIKAAQVRSFICFIWKNIITRFGIPMCIVFDHGCQFDYDTIRDYCAEFKIKYASASVCHPQSNGQAEAANKEILLAFQKKLEDHRGLWADLVPEVRLQAELRMAAQNKKVAKGAYLLMDMEGVPLKNSFNADVLKKDFA